MTTATLEQSLADDLDRAVWRDGRLVELEREIRDADNDAQPRQGADGLLP